MNSNESYDFNLHRQRVSSQTIVRACARRGIGQRLHYTMPSIGLALVCLICTSIFAQVPEGLAPYRFYKEVNRDAGKEEIVAITLGSDIFGASRDSYLDLRIVDDHGMEAAYVVGKIVETRSQISHQQIQTRVVSLKETDDNQIEVIVQLHDKAPTADGFTVHTPLKDYERRVRVFGSGEAARWVPLGADSLVFDYSRYMDISNGDVRLPTNNYRRFKVVIDDVTEERKSPYRQLTHKFRGGQENETIESTRVTKRPFRMDRLGFWHKVTSTHVKEAKKSEYAVADVKTEDDSKDKRTIIHVHTRREPLTAFTLVTDSRNFSRQATVEIPVVHGVQTKWVEIGRATLSMIDFGDLDRKELTIQFPEQRHEKYRIILTNDDNPPLSVTRVTAEGNTYRASFLATKDNSYRVFYGSETAEAPSYDTETISTSLREGYQPIEVQLKDQTVNPAFDTAADFAFGRLLENKAVLGVMIALMVVVLGWILLRAGRKVAEIPDE